MRVNSIGAVSTQRSQSKKNSKVSNVSQNRNQAENVNFGKIHFVFSWSAERVLKKHNLTTKYINKLAENWAPKRDEIVRVQDSTTSTFARILGSDNPDYKFLDVFRKYTPSEKWPKAAYRDKNRDNDELIKNLHEAALKAIDTPISKIQKAVGEAWEHYKDGFNGPNPFGNGGFPG